MSSVIQSSVPTTVIPLVMASQAGQPRRPLHRIRAVRRTERISYQQLARRMHIQVKNVIEQEDECCNLTLTELYQWQEALGVPVTELLLEPTLDLAPPTLKLGRMVKLMKTALALVATKSRTRSRRLAQNLVSQLLEIMPELKDVTAWPKEGTRRSMKDLTRATLQFLLPDGCNDRIDE
jgi:transcriptional regulator with XRE-family HTH domain